MDINEIKSVEQAKALAFDCVQRLEIEQNNLRILHQKIQELSQVEQEKPKKEKVKK
jgi:hypothetical protein